MWKITEHIAHKSKQDLKVKIMLNDLAEYGYATYAEQFENCFRLMLLEVKRANNYSADLMYKCTQRNLKSVEIWKLKVNGDFNKKLYTLDYVGS